jgi:transposase
MVRDRRAFTPEFKRESASLVLDQGYTLTAACNALDVGPTALQRWVRQLRQEREGITPSARALSPEQQKIQDLEARIRRLEQEKSILKKATALLMSDEMSRTH